MNRVQWVSRDELRANAYNPNSVAPPELDLLKLSIMEDGWTQPIVARKTGEIVDGFHRWTVSADPQLRQMTGGLVPVVFLDDNVPLEHQMMSTVRHNRARGEHAVLKMAEIVRAMIDEGGLTREEVGHRMKMEEEEVDRLYDHAGMVQRVGGAKGAFNAGWVPDKASKQAAME